MRTALNQRYFDAKPLKKLGKFARSGTTAEDNYRFRKLRELECGIAIEAIGWIDANDRRWGNPGTGGNDEVLRGDISNSPVIFITRLRLYGEKVHSMRVNKSRIGTDELELSVAKLFVAIIGKAFDEQIFARHDLFEIERNILNANTPRFGMAGEMHDLGGVKQRLGRHATAQNTKTADFFASFDHNGFHARICGRAGCAITSAAPADDGQVVIEGLLRLSHPHSMGWLLNAGKDADESTI
jgi:hypothetical protein